MKPPELIEKLKEMPQEKSIMCQVVANDGKCWNVGFEVNDIPTSWMIQLKVSHPALETLKDECFDNPELTSER